jgi:hypothetical protein
VTANLVAARAVLSGVSPGAAVPELSEAEMAHFRDAVRAFRDQGPVRVTPEKLAAYLEQTRDLPASPANRLRWLAIQVEYALFEHGWADPADYRVLHSWGLSASNWAAPGGR